MISSVTAADYVCARACSKQHTRAIGIGSSARNAAGVGRPSPDVNEAARGWVLLLLTGDPIPVAILCAECAANPELATMPAIARLVLEQSRGPVQ